MSILIPATTTYVKEIQFNCIRILALIFILNTSIYIPMNRLQQIIRAVIISWVIFFIGVMGYMVIEKWNFLDAVYMTAITVTTAGFMEVHELSSAGRMFTSIVLVAGVGYFFYIAGLIIQSIVEGEIKAILGRKRLDKKIRKLRNHYIICGYGRIGRVLSQLIKEETKDIVVIEKDETLVDVLEKDKMHYLHGDSSDEDLLEKAGIKNASFLIAALYGNGYCQCFSCLDG